MRSWKSVLGLSLFACHPPPMILQARPSLQQTVLEAHAECRGGVKHAIALVEVRGGDGAILLCGGDSSSAVSYSWTSKGTHLPDPVASSPEPTRCGPEGGLPQAVTPFAIKGSGRYQLDVALLYMPSAAGDEIDVLWRVAADVHRIDGNWSHEYVNFIVPNIRC